jgi:hypothetical protein
MGRIYFAQCRKTTYEHVDECYDCVKFGKFFITELVVVSAEVFCPKQLIISQDYKYSLILKEMEVLVCLCAVFNIRIHKMTLCI